MSLQEVLNKAKAESVNQTPLPGVQKCIENLEIEAITQIFQPRLENKPDQTKTRVAVGGRFDGQDFLNVNGLK